MKHYRITVDGETFDVELLDDPRLGTVRVNVDGTLVEVQVQTPPALRAEGPAEAAQVPPATRPVAVPTPVHSTVALASTERTLRAPLPGLVKSIAVSTGQQVAQGEEVVVIEAMKMDNVIRAPRAGKVERVAVTPGQQVPHGALLVEFAA